MCGRGSLALWPLPLLGKELAFGVYILQSKPNTQLRASPPEAPPPLTGLQPRVAVPVHAFMCVYVWKEPTLEVAHLSVRGFEETNSCDLAMFERFLYRPPLSAPCLCTRISFKTINR
jgi:hypothetical protein